MTDASASEPEARALLDHRLLIVTGKGGTGKTSVAAALAVAATTSGRRVLLCEMDAKGAAAAMLAAPESPSIGFEPREIRPLLWAMAMDTEQALREYLRLFSPLPFVTSLGPVAGVIDFVADAAPGVREILVIGKICWEVREAGYDLVIVDAESSGHVVSQISSPRTLRELVALGMIRDQTEWMLEILEDGATTAAVVVTTPEELPVSETIEVLGRITTETRTTIGGIIVNRMPAPVFDDVEIDRSTEHSGDQLVTRLTELQGIGEILAFAQSRWRDAAGEVARLIESCPGVSRFMLRELIDPTVDALAEVLTAQLDDGDSRTPPEMSR